MTIQYSHQVLHLFFFFVGSLAVLDTIPCQFPDLGYVFFLCCTRIFTIDCCTFVLTVAAGIAESMYRHFILMSTWRGWLSAT